MAISSSRQLSIQYTGDVDYGQLINADINEASPAEMWPIDLSSGNNTIGISTGGASVPTAVTIVPPSNNEATITLKGVNGDSGIKLHPTDPTTIALDPTVTSFVINVSVAVVGFRFYWS